MLKSTCKEIKILFPVYILRGYKYRYYIKNHSINFCHFKSEKQILRKKINNLVKNDKKSKFLDSSSVFNW